MRQSAWRALAALILISTAVTPAPRPVVHAGSAEGLSRTPLTSEPTPSSAQLAATELAPPWPSKTSFTPLDPDVAEDQIAASLAPPAGQPGAQSSADYTPLPSAEIVALADGLDDDPELIYQYVYNNVDFTPTWGLFQSPRDTYVSKMGNAFDQSTLLQVLLKAAGYQTEYVFGLVEIPLNQAKTWVGIQDNDALITAMTSYGGMTAEIDASVVRMNHVWTRVNVGGSWYPLDPSFKSYATASGINLASALGYNQASYLAAAEQGAQIGTDWVEDINRVNIESHLTQYATNLIAYLNQNAPFAYMDEVIGGREIVPIAVEGLPTQLPYTVTQSSGQSAALPDQHINKWRIEMPGITYTAILPLVLGERVTLFYEGATQTDRNRITSAGSIYDVYPAYDVDMRPHLRVDGQLKDTGDAVPLGAAQPVVFSLVSAVLDGEGDPYVFQYSYEGGNLIAGESYAFPMSAPTVSAAALQRHRKTLGESLTAGHDDQSESVLGQTLHLIGLSWLNEVQASDHVDATLAGVVSVTYFRALVISQDVRQEWQQVGDQWRVARVHMASFTVDVTFSFGGSESSTGDAALRQAHMIHTNLKASAAEGAVLEQLQDASAVSTARILHLANAQGLRIFRMTASNADAVLPLLDYDPAFEATLRSAAEAGNDLFVPQQPISVDAWYGTGWLALDPASGNTGSFITGGIGWTAARSPHPDAWTRAIHRGGSGTQEMLVDGKSLYKEARSALVGSAPDANDPSPDAPNNAGADFVDTATGAFLHSTTDLAFGVLGRPIRFSRTYVSDEHLRDSPLGFGWTHSYHLRLTEGSDWARSFGNRAAMDAVAAIAEAHVGLDALTSHGGTPPHQRVLIGAESADSVLGQMTGNSISVMGANGQPRQYLLLPDGTYRPAHGLEITLIRNGEHTYAEETKGGSRLSFDALGRATSLEDANGNQTTVTYDVQGNLVRVTDAVGRHIDLAYTSDRLTQITDPIGRTYHYAYDGDGNLVSYTDAQGGITTYTYDDEHRVLSAIDPEGIAFTVNVYDDFGRAVSQLDGRGGAMSVRYGDVRSTATDPMGYETVYFYDRFRRLSDFRDTLGHATSIDYDAQGHVLSQTDRAGRAVTFAYDARGNLTHLTDRLDHGTVFGYDAQDNLTSVTDALGHTTHVTYDPRRNPIGITDTLGHGTAFSYNAKGELTAATDANNHTGAFSYDTEGNLSQLTDPLGHTTNMEYDAVGRLTTLTDANGHTTLFSYDSGDNLIKTTDPLGHQSSYEYNGNDLLIGKTDARGHVTGYGYDGQFNLTHVTDALNHVTTYAYDPNHRLIRVTDARGHATHYQRDARGQVTRVTDPLGRPVRFAYDPNGNLITKTKADGVAIHYTYDAADRLTHIAYPDGNEVSHAYDPVGNVIGSAHGDWEVIYQYDALRRLITADLPRANLSLRRSYDPIGNRLSLEAERGGVNRYHLAYTYDAGDRLTHVTDHIAGQTIGYAYDAAGNVTSINPGNAAVTSYAYDADDRVALVENLDGDGSTMSAFAYTYDEVGNPLQVTNTAPGGSFVTSYVYDDLDRLTSEVHPRYTTAYEYDAVGNRTRLVGPLGTTDYDYDDANQLLNAGTVSFTYDANGNRISRTDARGTSTYSYDCEDRLLTISTPNRVVAGFAYDAVGRRVAESGVTGDRYFVYDGLSLILEEGPGSASGVSYTHGNRRLVARRPLSPESSGTAVTYHSDRLGSVASLSDVAGVPRGAFNYDAFGLVRAVPRSVSSAHSYLGQLGVRAEEAEGSLYLMGFRIYDAATGRFLSRDPLPGALFRPSSLNAYTYALSNPMRYVDPMGLRPDDEGLMLISDDPAALESEDVPLLAPHDWLCGGTVCTFEKEMEVQSYVGAPKRTVTFEPGDVIHDLREDDRSLPPDPDKYVIQFDTQKNKPHTVFWIMPNSPDPKMYPPPSGVFGTTWRLLKSMMVAPSRKGPKWAGGGVIG